MRIRRLRTRIIVFFVALLAVVQIAALALEVRPVFLRKQSGTKTRA